MTVDLQASYSQAVAALNACLAAQAQGAAIVEYEIGGRRIRRQDLAVAISELRQLITTLGPAANRQAAGGVFSRARFKSGY